MKFQIEPNPFIKMIQIVTESTPRQGGKLRLVASQGQVCVESEGITAEMDAAVAEEGQCTVSPAQMLKVLKRQHGAETLSIQAGRHGLHLGKSTLTVNSYRPEAAVPSTFQVVFASSWGLVHPELDPVRI